MPTTTVEPQARFQARPARDTDAKAVLALLSTNHNVEVAFDPAQFLVIEEAGIVVACGRLKPLTPAEAEIASVIVAADRRGHGLGTALVQALLRRAPPTVYALALAPDFFAAQGFRAIADVPSALVGKATSVCAKSGFVPMRRDA